MTRDEGDPARDEAESERGDDPGPPDEENPPTRTGDGRPAGGGEHPRQTAEGDPEEGYADVSLPGQESAESADDGGSTDREMPVPPEVREPLVRDRARERLGVSHRQWYVIETFLLVLPYPLFVLVYLSVDVDETFFLAVTLAYSLFAMYVGFVS